MAGARRGAARLKSAPAIRQKSAMDALTRPPSREGKFVDPLRTARGEPRAAVPLMGLKTLWINTGTLCNIECSNCYIESSPRNDRLAYITRAEVAAYLDEIARERWDTQEVGFTGGEPFMNPDLFGMLEDCLARGLRVLVLTNGMRPMRRAERELLALNRRFGDRQTIRVSLDHFEPERHDEERGPGAFAAALDALIWLSRHGFRIAVAGRTRWGGRLSELRAGYARLFAAHGVAIDAQSPAELVLFPEMDARADVPEITTACWDILGKSPADVMCASARMVVKRHGAAHPVVVACTLIPYDRRFELGGRLREAARPVSLNHRYCAQFCVLGGGSCSAPQK